MEDDNAPDIFKWVFKETTSHTELSSELDIKHDGKLIHCMARLKGNILALRATETAMEPVLVVCEKLTVQSDPSDANLFIITYGDGQHSLTLRANTEAEKEAWMLKISMASHQYVRAELDEIVQQYQTIPRREDTTFSLKSNTLSYFLTAPFVKEMNFNVTATALSQSRSISCTEAMYESRLSMMVPLEYIKLVYKWNTELCTLLKNKSWRSNTQIIADAAANVIQQVNSHNACYSLMLEYLRNYEGPSFRPSTDKYSLNHGPAPTNLHVQLFKITDKDVTMSCHFLTTGATAAIPLRFSNGGIYRHKQALAQSLSSNDQVNTNGKRFAARRDTLMQAKRQIGVLTRRIDTEWKIGQFGIVDQTGIGILTEIRKLRATVMDVIHDFPLVNNSFNMISTHCTLDPDDPNSLSNQLDALEMSCECLNAKMAVIDTVEGSEEGRKNFWENAKSAINSVLDILLQLIEGLLNAQVLSYVTALRSGTDCQNYFHAQLREDVVTSQILTIVITAILTAVDQSPPEVLARWDVIPPLFCYFSFLSCYSDERGMLEDMLEGWNNFSHQFRFKFIPASSSVSQFCVPQITGIRGNVQVTIPLLPALFSKLGPRMASSEDFHIRCALWNLGVNYQATIAQSFSTNSFEEIVNTYGMEMTTGHVNELIEQYKTDVTFPLKLAEDQLLELQNAFNECPSRKNMAIYSHVMNLMQTIGVTPIIGCKSGKDRTAMAVTLQEARFVKEHCGILGHHFTTVLESLRRNGVRLENCRKNVGQLLYSFSPFQIRFLPNIFRPPAGTYGQNVMS